jgi:hypothetical protein
MGFVLTSKSFIANSILIQQTSLAKNQDVVVVTINYRTNVFGFPYGSEAEVPLNERNLGLLDQEQGLRWTHLNIHAFGGDPNRIALMGQSAGASSISWFLQRHPVNPPFQSAILLSSAFLIEATLTTNETAWTEFATAVGCTEPAGTKRLQCLKQVPGSTIHDFLNGPTGPPAFNAFIDKCGMPSSSVANCELIDGPQYHCVCKPCTTYPRSQERESATIPGTHGKRRQRARFGSNGRRDVPQCYVWTWRYHTS